MQFDFTEIDRRAHEAAMAHFAQSSFAEGGPAELAYDTLDSPIGTLLVAVTRQGLVRIGFESECTVDVLERLAREISPAIIELPAAVAGVKDQLDRYFSGSLRQFDLALDRRLFTPFQQLVLTATASIPSGEVRSYGEVAALAGKPRAAQATGQALGANPIPVVIPCHRVVAADGSLHGYGGGLERKRFLLQLEQGAGRLF